MIEVKNVSKRYKKKLAVDDVSFTVQTGRVTGFVGPNGAGKSTTMRLMLGLDRGMGETLYDDKRLSDYEQPSKVVGLLLEAKAFHPTRTARNHLTVLAAAGGVPLTRVDEVLEMVGLTSVAKKAPGKFSLGMSQRLGIAAAILGKPKYLVLDEPANGLDPEGIAWLRKFIKNYAHTEGNGVLVSSHLLSEMSQMADDIIVIGKGKLITESSMGDLVASGTQTGAFVRTTNRKKLQSVLKASKVKFEVIENGLTVFSKTTDEVGQLVFDAGLPVLELTQRHASLEDAFLSLTASSEEYETKEKVTL